MDLNVPVVLASWGLVSVAVSVVAGTWLAALHDGGTEPPATDEAAPVDAPAAA